MEIKVQTLPLRILLIIIFFSINSFVYCGEPVHSSNGMVVTANELATKVGVEILKKGGNSIDAAVAVGYALAVTFPGAGNIGGGGFMVIHLADGRNTTIDFRETAPSAAYEKMYLDKEGNYIPNSSQVGWLSSGVPGTVAGLDYVLNKYGTMKLRDVIQPAIDLAEKGFILDKKTAEQFDYDFESFCSIKSSEKIFTNKGEKFKKGDLFVQKDLAATLKTIRDKGAGEFYNGSIADKFIEQSKLNGGIFSKDDLRNYHAIERKPVTGTYRGYDIVSMPPPSSGGVCLIEALNVLENYSLSKNSINQPDYLFHLVETMKRIYADRSELLGDPDFYKVPVSFLTSKKYAKGIFGLIGDTAVSSSKIKAALPDHKESNETTHYSIVDKAGNAVSTTYTLNGWFGNKIVVDGLGFLLNNQMDDFSSKPGLPNQYGLIGSKANSIQPNKRMLSSMTPTIVLKDGNPFLIVGSPGGSTIITSVLQIVINVLDFRMNIYDAIEKPRIHHQWYPDKIDYEEGAVSSGVIEALEKKGEKFSKIESLGRIEGISIDPVSKIISGASDPRGFGKAEGF
jgi:gamma-glutamyltranspeptidase/glutathione hydrolase